MHLCFIIYKTYSAPEIRQYIFVSGVKGFGELPVFIPNIFAIFHGRKVNLLQTTFISHTLQHIVGGTKHIILNRTGSKLCVQFFRCGSFLIFDFNAGFILKLFEYFRLNVFTIVEYRDGLFITFATACQQNARCKNQNSEHYINLFFHFLNLLI